MNSVGIMQGRLLPPINGVYQAFPVGSWQLEFPLARDAGLDFIEWVFDEPGQEQNPFSTDSGIAEIEKLSSEHGVLIRSVCANYYMTQRLISPEGDLQVKTLDHFWWFAERTKKLGARYVVLPILETSSLSSEAGRNGLLIFLEKIIPRLESLNLGVHLETDFPPKIFNAIMNRIDHPLIRVHFDIGNSASMGFDPSEELKLLTPKLGSVHVKDKMLGGSTVPLGTGNADFPTCFKLILQSGYDREFILEAARSEDGAEVENARRNRCFVENCIQSLALPDDSLFKS
jgi:L-ribulose-5-phosphate 3-epimerase